MTARRVGVYYAWSRPGESSAPLAVIEDRFPALFESRRMLYPRLAELADPIQFDQNVAGFLDHILKKNFAAFIEQASAQTGQQALEAERVGDDGKMVPLSDELAAALDTLIVISFDSLRTGQEATEAEVRAVRGFLAKPGNLLVVSPHHDIGHVEGIPAPDRQHRQETEFFHHGDKTIPPRQGFGGFGRSLLAGLGVPVRNRFGLRPAAEPDGSPTPIEVDRRLDRSKILDGVTTFNLHPHLPHFQRLDDAVLKMDVLARQRIDPGAPPHPAFTQGGRFDALLQSRTGVFAGDVLVCDATLWSSTAGGVDSLRRFWTNLVRRPHGDRPLLGATS
ncbi:hypothetical protein MSAS_22000 [Mycobacterium saskatchewanense]|uniref:Uncharacterized protein n=1 Tax=Mycobacterium saskatchewanense TaxID=220927 RepID=A0AAJ3NPK8_9MYCO|nr:hypothetical protein [Mycobacterium saskatchewanense]ORW70680.1 hypothetical protein AWC23_16505 [Mycobacterium saskatchewanense]BBX63026.1 hypothetical protein MSAS_22000 [Mycobacterium saskatchewanense]